jgi:hypothetical protein
MANTCPSCPDSSSHTHGACPPALGSHALSDHRSAGDKPHSRSDEYLEKHAAAPRNKQHTWLLGQR